MAIRVIIADDHPIVLDGLVQLFAAEDDIDVVRRCGNGDETLSAVRRVKPDVVIMDVRLQGRSGLDVLRAIREEAHTSRVILFAGRMSDGEVTDAVRLGVAGIVLKENDPRLLLQCVRSVAAGESCLESWPVSAKAVRRPTTEPLQLTPREIDIVRVAATGARNREIGGKLGISEGTVKMHLHSIYGKLRINGRVELTIYARENGLV
ncbi:MAG: response regulator transcription factor [Acidobacteriota bacterium]